MPVGTSLSGGIDSSTVVMLSSELAGDHTRHAFTARFPGCERDEWAYADEVARRAGVVEHHATEPTVEEVLADLPQLVLDHEEPVGSLSIYAQWRVMQVRQGAGVTVLLDGQGGDELFGGYPRDARVDPAQRLARRARPRAAPTAGPRARSSIRSASTICRTPLGAPTGAAAPRRTSAATWSKRASPRRSSRATALVPPAARRCSGSS